MEGHFLLKSMHYIVQGIFLMRSFLRLGSREDLSLTRREERNSIRMGRVRGGALFSSNIVKELTEQVV